jgi:hypothetical protein
MGEHGLKRRMSDGRYPIWMGGTMRRQSGWLGSNRTSAEHNTTCEYCGLATIVFVTSFFLRDVIANAMLEAERGGEVAWKMDGS